MIFSVPMVVASFGYCHSAACDRRDCYEKTDCC